MQTEAHRLRSWTEAIAMPTGADQSITELDEYDQNREKFRPEELAPYEGQWVAFSLDGRQLVAAAPDLLQLDKRLKELGSSTESVWLEMMASDEVRLGAFG
jgi:hypothetical protein